MKPAQVRAAFLGCFVALAVFAPLPAVAADDHQLALSIVGTSLEVDPATGLPARLTGDMFYRGGARDGDYAGIYEESLEPIIHPDYGFIGTMGVSTFTFMNNETSETEVFGSVTTENLSFITGVDQSTGALLVGSEGQIVGGTRRFGDVTGGLISSSSVMLFPAFSMDVELVIEWSHSQ